MKNQLNFIQGFVYFHMITDFSIFYVLTFSIITRTYCVNNYVVFNILYNDNKKNSYFIWKINLCNCCNQLKITLRTNNV